MARPEIPNLWLYEQRFRKTDGDRGSSDTLYNIQSPAYDVECRLFGQDPATDFLYPSPEDTFSLRFVLDPSPLQASLEVQLCLRSAPPNDKGAAAREAKIKYRKDRLRAAFLAVDNGDSAPAIARVRHVYQGLQHAAKGAHQFLSTIEGRVSRFARRLSLE